MTLIKFSTTIKKKEYLKVSFKIFSKRTAIRFFCILTGFVIITGSLNYFNNGDNASLNGAIVSMLLLVILSARFYFMTYREYSKNPLNFSNIQWTLDDDKISIKTYTKEIITHWTEVEKITEDETYYYIRFKNKKIVLFKRDDLTEDKREEFFELIALNKIK